MAENNPETQIIDKQAIIENRIQPLFQKESSFEGLAKALVAAPDFDVNFRVDETSNLLTGITFKIDNQIINGKDINSSLSQIFTNTDYLEKHYNSENSIFSNELFTKTNFKEDSNSISEIYSKEQLEPIYIQKYLDKGVLENALGVTLSQEDKTLLASGQKSGVIEDILIDDKTVKGTITLTTDQNNQIVFKLEVEKKQTLNPLNLDDVFLTQTQIKQLDQKEFILIGDKVYGHDSSIDKYRQYSPSDLPAPKSINGTNLSINQQVDLSNQKDIPLLINYKGNPINVVVSNKDHVLKTVTSKQNLSFSTPQSDVINFKPSFLQRVTGNSKNQLAEIYLGLKGIDVNKENIKNMVSEFHSKYGKDATIKEIQQGIKTNISAENRINSEFSKQTNTTDKKIDNPTIEQWVNVIETKNHKELKAYVDKFQPPKEAFEHLKNNSSLSQTDKLITLSIIDKSKDKKMSMDVMEKGEVTSKKVDNKNDQEKNPEKNKEKGKGEKITREATNIISQTFGNM